MADLGLPKVGGAADDAAMVCDASTGACEDFGKSDNVEVGPKFELGWNGIYRAFKDPMSSYFTPLKLFGLRATPAVNVRANDFLVQFGVPFDVYFGTDTAGDGYSAETRDATLIDMRLQFRAGYNVLPRGDVRLSPFVEASEGVLHIAGDVGVGGPERYTPDSIQRLDLELLGGVEAEFSVSGDHIMGVSLAGGYYLYDDKKTGDEETPAYSVEDSGFKALLMLSYKYDLL